MYRRGWKKEDLARKACFSGACFSDACYVLVEHYVALVLLVVQRALLQDNTSLSSTAAFVSNIDSVAPMLKIKDLLLSLVVAFDPISFLQEEINNRSVHEEKFQHHFREYAEYVNEIITWHEMWLQDGVNAFGMVEMSRRELFNRIVSAGGYEESRNNIVQGVVTNVTEADQRKEIQTSGETPNTLIDDRGKEMKKIDITIINSGTQTMPISEANVKEPIVLVDSAEETRITVDASHPTVSSLTNDKILSLVRDTIKNEVQLLINKITIPPRNTNNSNTTKTYLAYASEVGREREDELVESELGSSVLKNASTIRYDVDVDASDSASQVDRNNLYDDLSTVNYNASTVLTSTNENDDLDVPPPQTILTIGEPSVITADSGDTKIVGEDVSNNVTLENNTFPIGGELQQRINTMQDFEGVDDGTILLDTTASQFSMPENTMSLGEKNTYSIASDTNKNNNTIAKRIAIISAKVNNKIRAKTKLARVSKTKKLLSSKSKAFVRAQGKDIEKSLIETYPEGYEKREKKIHEDNAVKSLPSIREQKQLVRRRTEAKLPKDLSFSQQATARVGSTKKRKATITTSQLRDATMKSIKNSDVKLKQLQLVNKRLQAKQLAGRKIKIQKTIIENENLADSIESRLETMAKFQRNVPEILVTKPLPSSFRSSLTPANYSMSI